MKYTPYFCIFIKCSVGTFVIVHVDCIILLLDSATLETNLEHTRKFLLVTLFLSARNSVLPMALTPSCCWQGNIRVACKVPASSITNSSMTTY